jgi:hypothetical protein
MEQADHLGVVVALVLLELVAPEFRPQGAGRVRRADEVPASHYPKAAGVLSAVRRAKL